MFRLSLRTSLEVINTLKISQLFCRPSVCIMATCHPTNQLDHSSSEGAPISVEATSTSSVQPDHSENTEQDINDNTVSNQRETEAEAVVMESARNLKRATDENELDDSASEAKKSKVESNDESVLSERPFYKKKKVAMLLVYSGKGYTGMQMNPGMKTIENDLIQALVKGGVVTEDHASKPSAKMNFQRAARTDKGVSAAGQIVSLKQMFVEVENAVEKINSHLTPQIRVLGFKRTTRGFSSKDTCTARTYMYMLPTFAFTPVEEFVTDNFKLPVETREKINEVLATYKGTHNFHNFTSGKKPNDPSAHRYIMDMKIGEPFVRDNVEYAVITVKGQSFMLHQIRKMIGLVIAIIRGLASMKSMEYAWRPERADVPKAPGLGLVLEKLHYDAYNKRYGSDGMHEALEWDEFKEQIEQFKEEFIYKTIIETEKKERSMMTWLATLHHHHFEPRKTEASVHQETGLGRAHVNVMLAQKEEEAQEKALQEKAPEGDKVEKAEGPANDVDRPAGSAEDVDRPAGSAEDVDRPAGSVEDVDRPEGSGDDVDRPAGSAEDVDRPAGSAEDVDRPEGSGDDVDRPAGSGDDVDRPEG